MAKKILLSLLSGIFFLVFSTSLGASNPSQTTLSTYRAATCELPAPDSLRITSVGGDFIALAWQPISPDALHTLVVLEETGGGSWTNHSTYTGLGGDNHTVDGLEAGQKYRFILATECGEGDPSTLTAIIDGITLIIDLILTDRIPENPTPFASCQNIPYSNYNWVGFKITHNYTGISNFFEVDVVEPFMGTELFALVKRPSYGNPIVAIRSDGNFPLPNDPIVDFVFVPFTIRSFISSNPIDIGSINLTGSSGAPNTIDICPVLDDTEKPWNTDYSFTPMWANREIIFSPGGGSGGQGLISPKKEIFDVQIANPVLSKATLTFTTNNKILNNIIIEIFDINGKAMWQSQISNVEEQLVISTDSFPPGVYYLSVNTEIGSKTLKAFKY
jgi:hypothetical protein